jgi:4-amino-4-deoxy-L-arabinose transferase-like glycosyltransferase
VKRRLFLLLQALAIGIVAFGILWPGRADMPPVDRDESRYVQATRQMMESGDYLDIRYLDVPRYQQPAGVYWMQAAAVAAAGTEGARVIWPHRIPSWLCGAFAAMLTCWMGARLFGSRTGWLAGLLFATCLLFNFEARLATTDASLLACVMAAQASLLLIWQNRDAEARSRAAPFVFWIALGIGGMVKGPVAFAFVGLTLLALAVAERRARWMRDLRPLMGALIVIAIVAPWLIAIEIKTGGDFLRLSLFHNFAGKIASGQEAHSAPPGYYLALFPAMFWPGSLLAFRALPGVFAARKRAEVVFLLCWIIPAWLMFEAVATKLPHYMLPLYPAVAILAAAPLAAPEWRRWQRIAFGAFAGLWGVVGVALALGLPLALLVWNGVWSVPGLVMGAFAAFLLVWMLRLTLAARLGAAICCGAVAAALVFASGFGEVVPRMTRLWLSPQIASMVAAAKPCPVSTLAAASYHEPSLVFLLGPRIALVVPEVAAADLLANRACGMALVSDADMPRFLAPLTAAGVTPHADGTVSGVTYSNGRAVTLRLFDAAR